MQEFLLQMVLVSAHEAGLVYAWWNGVYRYYQTNDNIRARFAFRASDARLVGGCWIR